VESALVPGPLKGLYASKGRFLTNFWLAMRSLLSSIAAFQGLGESGLHILEQNIERLHLAAGQILFRQGDSADCFFIVASGTLKVEVALPDNRRQLLATLGSSDCVGEIALLFQKPRSATVYAASDSELLKIPASALDELFAAHPTAQQQFLVFASRRLLSLHLASLPLFAGIDPAILREFDSEANWLRLAGGETLFAQGDPPDYLYIVIHGRLEIIVERESGEHEVLEQIGRGDCVGEMALLADEPRSATVRAIRDSELLRLSKNEFSLLLNRHPRGTTEIARMLVRRLRQTTAKKGPNRRVSTITLLSSCRDGVFPAFTEKFVQALSAAGGSTLHLNSRRLDLELGQGSATGLDDEARYRRIVNRLNEQEDKFRYIVFECDPFPSKWTDLCLRQGDLIFLVASSDSDPHPGEIEGRVLSGELGNRFARKELVLVHRDGSHLPVGTMKWLRPRRVSGHHQVRLNCIEDYHRLARFATGSAVGVVFGGGGARGYLHVGAVQALRESGVPIDLVGGCSIGSIAAAQCALDYDMEKIIEMSTTGYGKTIGINLIRDVTFPSVAFLSGRSALKMLKAVFGDVCIEDLWLPYFCVSANLSTAEVVVHEQGPLWFGIRASASFPGIFPPVQVRGELLVDGGLLNNLPMDTMRSRAGTVIAIDIALPVDLTVAPQLPVVLSGWPVLSNLFNPFAKKKSLPHIFEILSRSTTLGSIHNTDTFKEQADLYLHLVASGVDTFDWKAGRKLIEIGYRYALVEIEKWQKTGEIPRCHTS
jgi:CRP-like cAMP-binding protein/predicted acylesterase/phospholipase RssA